MKATFNRYYIIVISSIHSSIYNRALCPTLYLYRYIPALYYYLPYIEYRFLFQLEANEVVYYTLHTVELIISLKTTFILFQQDTKFICVYSTFTVHWEFAVCHQLQNSFLFQHTVVTYSKRYRLQPILSNLLFFTIVLNTSFKRNGADYSLTKKI